MLPLSWVALPGVTPSNETNPRVGLYPTIPLNPAGTRPEPAVSVANENVACSKVSLSLSPIALQRKPYQVRTNTHTTTTAASTRDMLVTED